MKLKTHILIAFIATLAFTSTGQDSLVKYHENGKVKLIYFYPEYRKQKKEQNDPYRISYFTNGTLKTESYLCKNGVVVNLQYSDSIANQIVSGRSEYGTEYSYRDNILISKTSAKERFVESRSKNEIRVPYSIETGVFENFILKEGTIKYYTSRGELTFNLVEG